ncbi:3-deoxy-D-manno-octulosonic acid transferase [Persephonella sp.]
MMNIYTILYTVFVILYLPIFSLLTRKKGYKTDIKERFVIYNDNARKNTVWFHCASIGELNVAFPVINRLKEKYSILITVSSPRGKDFALKKYPFATVRSVPLDIPFLLNRFISIYKPQALVITEGEFWPNLVCKTSEKIPILSINTRISPNSFKVYKRFRNIYKKILDNFSKFIVRSEKDREYLSFFVPEEKLVLCGDLKLVSSFEKKEVSFNKKGKRIIIAGSTHDPEEKVLITIYKNLRLKYPDLRLVLAPRHLERIDQIKNLLEEEGLSYALRSETEVLDCDVYIVDTIGELSGLYRYADVVFVGGTIAPVGGHNILEPVAEGKPVIIGNHYHKIEDLYRFLRKFNAVFSADNGKEMERLFDKFLEEKFKPDINISAYREKVLLCYIKNIEECLG